MNYTLLAEGLLWRSHVSPPRRQMGPPLCDRQKQAPPSDRLITTAGISRRLLRASRARTLICLAFCWVFTAAAPPASHCQSLAAPKENTSFPYFDIAHSACSDQRTAHRFYSGTRRWVLKHVSCWRNLFRLSSLCFHHGEIVWYS